MDEQDDRGYVLEVNPQNCGKLFTKSLGLKLTHDPSMLITNPDAVKLLVMTGGEDVSPRFYKSRTGNKTFCNPERDVFEKKIFDEARRLGKPIVGICRGSQAISAFSGNQLIQHLDSHAGCRHTVSSVTGETFVVNSSHHQMQLPQKDYVLLAWASPRLSGRYLDGDNQHVTSVTTEVEAVYYYDDDKLNALGIQWHPEWLREDERAVTFVRDMVEILVGENSRENFLKFKTQT